jgi:hypothetical protein
MHTHARKTRLYIFDIDMCRYLATTVPTSPCCTPRLHLTTDHPSPLNSTALRCPSLPPQCKPAPNLSAAHVSARQSSCCVLPRLHKCYPTHLTSPPPLLPARSVKRGCLSVALTVRILAILAKSEPVTHIHASPYPRRCVAQSRYWTHCACSSRPCRYSRFERFSRGTCVYVVWCGVVGRGG